MPADKPTELSRIKLKNLNSTARPYDQQAFSPPDPTAIWHSHLALAIYIFVVVNFDALAQASDIRIERRQVVFLCWEHIHTYIHTYIFVGLILMLWHRETHINPQRNRWIIVDQAGIELTTSRLRQLRQLPVVQHVRFTPLKSRQKTQLQWRARGCTGQLTTRLECTGVNFNTCVC